MQRVGCCVIAQAVTRQTNAQSVFCTQIILKRHLKYRVLFVLCYVTGCFMVGIQLFERIVGTVGLDPCLTSESIFRVGHFVVPSPKNRVNGFALAVYVGFAQNRILIDVFLSHQRRHLVGVIFLPSVQEPCNCFTALFKLQRTAFFSSLLDFADNVALEAIIQNQLRNELSSILTTNDVLNANTAFDELYGDLVVQSCIGVAEKLLRCTRRIGIGNDNLRKQLLLCRLGTLRGCHVIGVCEENVFGGLAHSIGFYPSNFSTASVYPQLIVAVRTHQFHRSQFFLRIFVNLCNVILNVYFLYFCFGGRILCCEDLNGEQRGTSTQHHNNG